MTKVEFSEMLTGLVNEYIANFYRYDSNPQVRINPDALTAELVNGSDMQSEVEDSDEAVENAAAAQGMETQEAAEYQVEQNPDFYAVKSILKPQGDTDVPDSKKIAEIVDVYFSKD